MKTVIIRTTAGVHSGLGHLYRCNELAKVFISKNVKVIFLLDVISKEIAQFISQQATVFALYDDYQDELNLQQDAKLVADYAKQYQADGIILDDYRLTLTFEQHLKQLIPQTRVTALDDIKRHHHCDVLVDYKYRGVSTQQGYDKLTPSHCVKLLGPEYVILPKIDLSSVNAGSELDMPTIMLSLGGGGDLSILQPFIEQLTHVFKNNLLIKVLVGPLAINVEQVKNAFATQQSIQWLEGVTNVAKHLSDVDLFFGCAGGILYQLMALKIPCLTFAISQSQQTSLNDLEAIGHYFHLSHLTDSSAKQLPEFVNMVLRNKERLIQLIAQADQKIDHLGCQRIVDILLHLPDELPPVTQSSSPEHGSKVETVAKETLSKSHTIEAVTDKDINRYLDARNLKNNSQNMIEQQQIERLPHYSWWFSTKRESYLLKKDGMSCLYIWHEIKQIQQKHYLIGGWFVCDKQVGFDDALIALNWQISRCNQQYPNIPWVAVIHKQNKFVKLLNQYMGFKAVTPESEHGIAIAQLFPKANNEQFDFVSFCATEQSK